MKGELKGDLADAGGGLRSPSNRGDAGVSPGKETTQKCWVLPWSHPHPKHQLQRLGLAAGGEHWSLWRGRIRPKAGPWAQRSSRGRRGRKSPPLGWILLPSPLTITSRWNGEMGSPSLQTHWRLRAPRTSPYRGLFQTFGFDFWLFPN